MDLKTGTVMARGIFPNPGNALRPGQYAKVRAVTEVKKNSLLVPQRAVLDVQGVRQVAVVGADNSVDIRPVQSGPRTGSLWIIEQGVKPGERVVVHFECRPCPMKRRQVLCRCELRRARPRLEDSLHVCVWIHTFTCAAARTRPGRGPERAKRPGAILALKKGHD